MNIGRTENMYQGKYTRLRKKQIPHIFPFVRILASNCQITFFTYK